MDILNPFKSCNDQEADGDLDCLVDDESDSSKKYQNENVYNRLLPYDISDECQLHLMRIKTSLAKCIQLDQETSYEWFPELERFVDLYGLSFSKEDHIYFVRLQYGIMTHKGNMDLCYITDVARCFARLMRKRYLIGSDELILDWRPLYEAYERLLFSKTERLGLRFVPETLESYLSQVIRLSRPHFPAEATQEMLDEWRPMLYPFNLSSIQRTVTYLNLFLPTTLAPEHHGKGFKLWFDEVMQLWLSGKAGVSNDSKFTLLLSRLSSDCLGYVDWEPYIPMIFNQFKANLNLNGAMSRNNARRANGSADVRPCVQWMVYMINVNGTCLDHIEQLFKAIESFYHPSNTDRRWHAKLQQFLYQLPACYVKRLYKERHKNNIWSRRIPESHRLTDEQTSRFVDALLPVVITSMFNQSGVNTAALAFRDLAVLRPEKVVPPLLERLYGSYETLTEPHRLVASINCMASVVPVMVRPCSRFLECQNHVVPLLLNSLPGIDSNDMRKCIAVFRFIATIAAHVRMKDYSYLVDERTDLTPEKQQLCLSTSQFEDFVVQFLDKCFILIENSTSAHTFSNPDHDAQIFRSGEEGIIEAAISSVTLSILAQASKEIQQAALDKLYSHVTRHLFDTKTQGQAISTLCLACAKVLPRETLFKFVPHFGRLVLMLTENEEVFQETNLDHELTFSLLLLSEIVRCNSSYILEHKQLILQVLHRALKLKSKEAYILGCGTLRHLLRALTNVACCDWRNVDLSDEITRKNEELWPFDNWGHTMNIKDLNLKWEIPGRESREFAFELLETFLKQAMEDLLSWTKNESRLSREEVQRSLHVVLSSLVGAASVLPSVESPTLDMNPYEVPVFPMCISNTGTDPLCFSSGEQRNIRNYIVNSIKIVLQHIMTNFEDDTKSLWIICEILTTIFSYFGYNKAELRLAAQRIKSLKASTQNKLLGGKRHLRYLLVERVAQQQRAMLLNKGHPDFTKLHLDIFDCLFRLSQSHYVDVRIAAQDGTYLMINYFPFLETVLVPRLVHELSQPTIEHKKFKGLLYLVAGRRSFSSIAIDPDWSTLSQLWPALITSPHSEKPSIVRQIDRICNLIAKGFDTFQLKFGFPDEVKSQAALLWSSEAIDKARYPAPDAQLISQVNKRVQERNECRVKCYEQLVERLVGLVDDPQLHWHKRGSAYSLFSLLLREDYPLSPNGLQLCLNNLINDRLSFRIKAVQLVAAQLKLHKRKHIKRKLQTTRSQVRPDEFMQKANSKIIGHEQMSQDMNSLIEAETKWLSLEDFGCQKIEDEHYQPQMTDDLTKLGLSNRWMQYKLSDEEYTKSEWERLIFVDKFYIGYYDWPKELEVYEPYNKQPELVRAPSQMNAHELMIYQKFQDTNFVEKLVGYFCFEEQNKINPEIRRFDTMRPTLFEGLFRNYGPCMIEPFKKYLLEYSGSDCEQQQRFVIELLAGLIRGSKHWSYDMLSDLKRLALPIIDKLTITQKNFNDWTGMTNYVFRNRDVKRLDWLLGYLVTKATSPKEVNLPAVTPFIQASRLTVVHYALIQCEWRAVSYIFPKIVENLRDQDHLLTYANVRVVLASLYSLIFMFDDRFALSLIPNTLANVPNRRLFIEQVKSKLSVLEKEKLTLLGEEGGAAVTESDDRHKGSPMGLNKRMKHGTSDSQVSMDGIASSSAGATSILQHPVDESVVSAAASTDDHEMELLAETLIKFRQLDTNPDSPPSPSSSHHHVAVQASHLNRPYQPHRDQAKVSDKSATPPSVVGSAVTRASSFVDSLRESLPSLGVPSAHHHSSSVALSDATGDTPERRQAIKLMKFYCCWVIYNVIRMKSPVPSDFFKMFPLICEMGREVNDPLLTADSLAAVAVLGGLSLSPEAVVVSLKCIREIIAKHSRHARVAAAAFVQILVSSNLSQLICCEEWRSEIEDIVIDHLICDERIEVRESSSQTLSGMIHCQFIKLTPELIEKFKKRANHPLAKRKQTCGTTVIDLKSTVIRHSGVLCLCACVDAHPYTVPDYLPGILTFLSDHLTDPQPICTTIKKTMSNFRRTHHDNWQSDKTRFTDDQLSLLADLLVSPSYYA